ncbi:conserved hypothetical protein [Acidobacteriia bacterium SbA2]|nr:conserved hypothetical protein [Acidobacteriia bacterium SbA2]
MNPWEESLREALRRKDAPPGFSDRVLARVRDLPAREKRPWFRAFFARPALRWAAAVLCLAIAVSVAYRGRQERQRRQGELARVQVKQALRIASVKLNAARRMVQEVNQGTGQSRL